MSADTEHQILDRVIRMESRLVQLGDYVGANLRSKQRIDVSVSSIGVAVEIDALDVSISRILAELKLQAPDRVEVGARIPIFHKGKCVANLMMAAL